MRNSIAITTALLAFVSLSQFASACGYGLFDPDVETAMSGDPIQAQLAVDRIMKRGRHAIPALKRYQMQVERAHQSHANRLHRLYVRDRTLHLSEEHRQSEIERSRNYLEWSVERIRKLDIILFQLNGNDFGGQAWNLQHSIG